VCALVRDIPGGHVKWPIGLFERTVVEDFKVLLR
jgi:hypothetical protein